MSAVLVHHDDCLLHDTGTHPENAGRLLAIIQRLRATGLWDRVGHCLPRPATREAILSCHTEAHWNRIVNLGQEAEASHVSQRADPDTVISPGSVGAALLAAGAVIAAVDAVCSGDNQRGFALIRPPGHHATPNRAMGFCLFNNIGVAAKHARQQHGLQRVAIVDWDVHHGNGTQDLFYSDPDVFFFSLHQHPWYPGTGMAEETGEGSGRGTTMNVPLRAGHGDESYLDILQNRAGPALRAFQPEILMVSAGFDCRLGDPLGGMRVTDAGFAAMARMVRDWADTMCQGRLVLALEGGYNLDGLAGAVAACVEELV